MNCKLVVLLLGALCTIGCVRAGEITLEDAKRAINEAWELYEGSDPNQSYYYNKQMIIQNGDKVIKVEVKCEYQTNDRFNCGLLPFLQMSEKWL